ncbi:MAG: hypothetical protein HKN82_19250 [Akkermansiaceae bacterium]|nr:hypothetical protein [Akkermansiaceae bacterium]
MTGNYFAALPVIVPAGWLPALRNGAPPGLRWFHPGDLHLTLAFFGREDPARLPALREVLEAIPFPGATVTLGTLRGLPSPRRLSALAFTLAEGRDEVAAVIGAWRGPLCAAAGVDPDSRPPLPHLTVARPARKDPAFRPRAVRDWMDSLPASGPPVQVLAPALFGWAPDRPRRQFRLIP